MTIYRLYPFNPKGSAVSFKVVDLASEEQLAEAAQRLLSGRPTCIGVMVYRDGERLATYRRPEPEAPSAPLPKIRARPFQLRPLLKRRWSARRSLASQDIKFLT